MIHLLDVSPKDLEAELLRMGETSYRAKQILQWVWSKGAADFAAMTNLSAALREKLLARASILSGKVIDRHDSSDGVTKLLLEWPDGQRVETVLIPADKRATACVSTQAGCPVGCAFCASGQQGLGRNLTAGEIVEQVLQLQQAAGQKVTHVVFMGMGEPLANYDATLSAVRTLIDPERGGLSGRHITISTIGIPAAMRKLAGEGIPLTLAISLHAPDERLRRRLIPAAKAASIEEIIAAAQDYFRITGREVTVEYLLLADVNDQPEACRPPGRGGPPPARQCKPHPL